MRRRTRPARPGVQRVYVDKTAAKRRSGFLLTVLTVLFIGILAFGGYHLAVYLMDWQASKRTDQELREAFQADQLQFSADGGWTQTELTPDETVAPALFTPQPSSAPIPILSAVPYPGNEKREINERFQALKKKNKDIVGWLNIEYLIDGAVVQRDNNYYLNHDAMGRKNSNGAFFLDAICNLSTRPYSLMIYGHNMKSGAMFGPLRNFENLTFYHNSPIFTFILLISRI